MKNTAHKWIKGTQTEIKGEKVRIHRDVQKTIKEIGTGKSP